MAANHGQTSESNYFQFKNSTATLFVGNLPQTISQNKLEKLFADVGPIRRSFIVRNKGVGYVTFALRDDAEKAIENGVYYEGRRLNLKYAKKRAEQPTARNDVVQRQEPEKKRDKPREKHVNPKKARLIIRNISFKADEDALRSTFSKFGEINETVIPRKPDGKMRGFCFVQFTNVRNAHKAMQEMNGKEWMGRPIAIDFSLPKLKYLDLKQEETASNPDVETAVEDDIVGASMADPEEKNKNESSEKSSDRINNKSKKLVTSSNDSEDEKSIDAAADGDDESEENDTDDSEDDDDDEDGSEGDENSDVEDEHDDTDDTDDENDNEDSSDEGDNEDGGDEEPEGKPEKSYKKRKDQISDVDEGKTLFIRNIGFETTNEDLLETFSEYGKLQYAVVCINPNTEYSKGSGFVKFCNKEDADACIAKSEKKEGILINGQKMVVSLAIKKEALMKMAEDKKRKPKDNRNLYLAREGLIRPGTEAAADVSKSDLDKRVKLEVWKHSMLRNLNIFVSKYRLCVRNIPETMGDKRLRAIFATAAGDGAEVTEARIMRDFRQFGANGVAPSKGYGFVRFTTHDHALKALRHTNNNPDIFTKNARPIVEFSLENRQALNAQQKRQERSVLNNTVKGKSQKTPKSSGDERVAAATSDGFDKLDSDALPFSGTKTDASVKKGLPSHVGPKIRHKGRGNAPKISRQKLRRQKAKMMQNKRTKKWEKVVKPPKKKRPVDREEVNLQKSISRRKRKLQDKSDGGPTKRHKWFD